jgi:hypothetical protein
VPMDIRSKIAPWYFLFGAPFLFLVVSRVAWEPWLVGVVAYMIGTTVVVALHENFAYRITSFRLFRPFLLNFVIACAAAVLFAHFTGFDLADLLKERPY